MWFFPLSAAILSTVAAGVLLRIYLVNRNPAYLAWSFSVLIFAIASACAFIGSYDSWSETTVRIYYLAAVVSFSASMSLGTVYINAPRVIGHIWLAVLAAVAFIAAIVISGADIDATVLMQDEAGWRAVEFSSTLAGIVTALSSVSMLIIVLAAVTGLVYRRAGLEQIMIAVGVILVELGGALARLDSWEWSSAGQTAGILVILMGAVKLSRLNLPDPSA
jgi:hypothetical protein